MLPSEQRLNRDKEFDLVFKNSRGSYGQTVGVKSIRNEKLDSRYGIVVSQKVSKKATVRNRFKRLISESIRRSQAELAAGFDVVVICLPAISKFSGDEIRRDLLTQLSRQKLIRPAK